MAEAGVRELRNNLSRYLEQVREGEEVTVTDRGVPIARIVPVDAPTAFEQLVRDGVVALAPVPGRSLPGRRVRASGGVSDLAATQRR
jgi:prevent-host-death family protein